MSHFYSAGAFVVQFRTATNFDLGRVEGRVEHVASGRIAHFASASELVEMLARLLKAAPADLQSCRDGGVR